MNDHIDENGSVKLQPLRISSGWTIDWFTFPDIDPTEETIELFDSSSLLTAYHESCHLHLDVAWEPEMDINGQFVLKAHSYLKTFDEHKNIWRIDVDWSHPVVEFETKSKKEVISKIEEILRVPPCFSDPRFIKATGVIIEPQETYRLELESEGPNINLAKKIAETGDKRLQLLFIDHPEISPQVLSYFIEMKRILKGPKKKAIDKLNSRAFKTKHGI